MSILRVSKTNNNNEALAIASQQGQKIWTINKDNITLALNSINLGADTESDIRNAVNAGKIVTTHEAKINFNGWVGEGYIVMEAETGTAAYMIAGGGNGGFISDNASTNLMYLSFGLTLLAGPLSLPILFYIGFAIALLLILDLILDYNAIDHNCEGLGALIYLSVLLALAGVFAGPVMAIILLVTSMIAGNGTLAVAQSAACKPKKDE